MLWLLLALGLLAGIFRAVHDPLTHSPQANRITRWAWGLDSRFWRHFFDPAFSWRNKYKGGEEANGPAFPGSTTWLVAFTDAWHLSNLLAWLAADAAVLVLAWAGPHRWAAVGYVAARRLIFEPVYRWLRL